MRGVALSLVLVMLLSGCIMDSGKLCNRNLHDGATPHEWNLCRLGVDQSAELRHKIGMEYLMGTDGATQDCPKAAYWLQTSAEMADISSLIVLGEMYGAGIVKQQKPYPQCVEKNVMKAQAYLRAAQHYIEKKKRTDRVTFVPTLEGNVAALLGTMDQNELALANEDLRKMVDERP